MKAAHLAAAIRALASAEADLLAAGKPGAAMRIGAVLRSLK